MREVQERRAQSGWGPGSSAPRCLMSRKCAFPLWLQRANRSFLNYSSSFGAGDGINKLRAGHDPRLQLEAAGRLLFGADLALQLGYRNCPTHLSLPKYNNPAGICRAHRSCQEHSFALQHKGDDRCPLLSPSIQAQDSFSQDIRVCNLAQQCSVLQQNQRGTPPAPFLLAFCSGKKKIIIIKN